jgi:UDP-GlcNAc:undecaprenyl-phosphate/decaprenyl-phosphate GlcNAc-1-phosphate transferase
MSQSHFYLIISIFILFQILIILYFKNLSTFFNFFDSPDNIRKKHSHKTSLLGGSIIFLSLIFNYVLFLIDNFFVLNQEFFFKSHIQYMYFSVTCFLMFAIGLVDDKYNLGHFAKMFSTSIVIFTLVFLDKDLVINKIQLSFYSEIINVSKISLIFTTLCFLLFINAVNMFDGIDGQVGLYSLFILSLILFFTGINDLIIFLLISFITFLCLNLQKKCFLGDSGTILIGFIFSYLLIKLYKSDIIYFADKIFLIMIIPGLDMLRLFAERLIKKKNPFKGDNNHIHHLFQLKFSKFKSILYSQLLIIIPVISSFYFNLLMIIFLTIIIYFLIITILKSYDD